MPSEGDRTANDAGRPLFRAAARIYLVPLHPDPPAPQLVRWLADELKLRLSTEVEVAAPLESESSWRAAQEGQLSSGAIVDSLMSRFPAEDGSAVGWALAIATNDLQGGGRDYVFGEATFEGAWAVVSTARFGAPGDPHFRARLLREALHELGHLAGLRHCMERSCLMSPAATAEDVDAAGMEPCPRCSHAAEGT